MYNKMPWPVSPAQAANAANAAMPMMPGSVIPMGGPGMPMMPGMMPQQMPGGSAIPPGGMPLPSGFAPEESYVENILRMNLGKIATLYMTYENNSEWNAKIFKGALEAAGRDHIIISDPATGKRYLLLTLNLDYITFDEPLNYTLPFGGGQATTR